MSANIDWEYNYFKISIKLLDLRSVFKKSMQYVHDQTRMSKSKFPILEMIVCYIHVQWKREISGV